jgi:hypothetical protein
VGAVCGASELFEHEEAEGMPPAVIAVSQRHPRMPRIVRTLVGGPCLGARGCPFNRAVNDVISPLIGRLGGVVCGSVAGFAIGSLGPRDGRVVGSIDRVVGLIVRRRMRRIEVLPAI